MLLLTGATGFVGTNLLRELLKEGLAVRCLVRSPSKGEALKALGGEVAYGDITDRASISRALEGVDTVVHLVGILVEVGKVTFEAIHTEGTRNMVEACKERDVKRFIHISALGTRPNARSQYHKTKWKAEEIIRASGLEHTIFRPSVIFGKEDKFTNLFASAIRLSPVVIIPGNGKNRMQPVFVKDLVKAMVMSIKDPGHINRTYEIGGSEKLNFDEIIDTICRVLGRRRLKCHIPMVLMRPGATIVEFLLSKPPITRDQLLMLEEDNTTEEKALEVVFGITPTRFEEGMREYLSGQCSI